MPRETQVVVSGLVDEQSVARLRQLDSRLILASSPSVTRDGAVDLTPYDDGTAVAAAFAELPKEGALAVVYDQQLERASLVEYLQTLRLRCIVLNTEVSYDTDPSWLVSRLEWAQGMVSVACFALDIFTEVEDSWATFVNAGDDEFGPPDLQRICSDFSVVLTTNLKPENVKEVASFPGAKGVLLTCENLLPVRPVGRHTLSLEAISQLLPLIQIG